MENLNDDRFPVLIERRLKMQRSTNDDLIEIVVEIGTPYWTKPDIEAACPVAIRGCLGRVNDIRGIDPLNAMKQAISFVEIYLDRSTNSEKFFWPDGEEYSDG
ncbi:DUF6968 family protein [Thauera sinica]|uniref:DUF6968 family protein n=1 Tax=Thauera sinica TaxID=2665146 RepID=A0ABW1AVC5_9RHOO|nr:hypothetical protein [Thauera sp. K11]